MFLDAEVHYNREELALLRRALRCSLSQGTKPTTPDGLRDFFFASYAARRRPPLDATNVQDIPVSALFVVDEEYLRIRRDAMLNETRVRLLDMGLSPAAAFASLALSNPNELVPADLRATREHALGFPPRLWLGLFHVIQEKDSGVITLDDWKAALDTSEEDTHMGPSNSIADHSSMTIQPPKGVPLDVLTRLQLELVCHSAYVPLWNSQGTMSREHVSIWAPDPDQLISGMLRTRAIKLCIGHYAQQGYVDAKGGDRFGVGTRRMIQVRDCRAFGGAGKEFLEAVGDHYFPRPAGFRQVWTQHRGKPLFVWRPLPSSDAYVALGMVVTTTPEPPPVDIVRCVPKAFCRSRCNQPARVWDDSGSGGKPGSIWVINSLQTLWTVVGHGAPTGTSWELASHVVTFNSQGLPVL